MNSTEITALIEAQRVEGLQLEYKRDLPGNSDSAKSEFLADVCALANASGGSILFGIGEADGCAEDIVGVPSDDLDAVRLRLDSIIRSGIEPRLQRLSVSTTKVGDAVVLEITVGPSFYKPHWVSARDERRFYVRTSAGKARMSIDEVRAAFQASGGVYRRAAEWRANSIAQLVTGTREIVNPDTIWMCLHICPTSAFDGPMSAYFDPKPIRDHSKRLRTISTDNTNSRPHYDGMITEERGPTGDLRERLLVRRDFRVEAVWKGGGMHDPGRMIYAGGNEERLNRWLEHFLMWAKENGYPFPAFLLLSITNAKGSHIPSMFHRYEATSDTMELRPVFVEDMNVVPSVLMKPAYDHLWQSYGFDACVLYNENGEFDRQRYDPRSA